MDTTGIRMGTIRILTPIILTATLGIILSHTAIMVTMAIHTAIFTVAVTMATMVSATAMATVMGTGATMEDMGMEGTVLEDVAAIKGHS